MHPLGQRTAATGGRTDGLGRALQQALLGVIEGLRSAWVGPPERSARIHRLLVLRYIDGLEPSAVWPLLGIGKSEYYREHSHGITAVASVLWMRLNGSKDINGARLRLPRQLTTFIGREREQAEV